LRLTVIGNNGIVPRPGGASSSYLVEQEGTRVLLDCGTGAWAHLQRIVQPFALDAIFISHIHPDHFFDLVPFRYALRYTLAGTPPPVPLWVPPGARRQLDDLALSFGGQAGFFDGLFAVREFDPADVVSVGSLTLTFQAMRHYVPSFGLRVGGDAQFAYSADTALCDEVVGLAAGADLFLCEATAQARTVESTKGGHMSAGMAGEVAAKAGVPRLLLTHIWYELDPQVSLAEARATYGGNLALAEEGRTYEIRPAG